MAALAQSTIAPPLRFATVPVIALARSEAMNAATRFGLPERLVQLSIPI